MMEPACSEEEDTVTRRLYLPDHKLLLSSLLSSSRLSPRDECNEKDSSVATEAPAEVISSETPVDVAGDAPLSEPVVQECPVGPPADGINIFAPPGSDDASSVTAQFRRPSFDTDGQEGARSSSGELAPPAPAATPQSGPSTPRLDPMVAPAAEETRVPPPATTGRTAGLLQTWGITEGVLAASVVQTSPCLVPTNPSLVPTSPCLVPTSPSLVPTSPCLVPASPCLVPASPSINSPSALSRSPRSVMEEFVYDPTETPGDESVLEPRTLNGEVLYPMGEMQENEPETRGSVLPVEAPSAPVILYSATVNSLPATLISTRRHVFHPPLVTGLGGMPPTTELSMELQSRQSASGASLSTNATSTTADTFHGPTSFERRNNAVRPTLFATRMSPRPADTPGTMGTLDNAGGPFTQRTMAATSPLRPGPAVRAGSISSAEPARVPVLQQQTSAASNGSFIASRDASELPIAASSVVRTGPVYIRGRHMQSVSGIVKREDLAGVPVQAPAPQTQLLGVTNAPRSVLPFYQPPQVTVLSGGTVPAMRPAVRPAGASIAGRLEVPCMPVAHTSGAATIATSAGQLNSLGGETGRQLSTSWSHTVPDRGCLPRRRRPDATRGVPCCGAWTGKGENEGSIGLPSENREQTGQTSIVSTIHSSRGSKQSDMRTNQLLPAPTTAPRKGSTLMGAPVHSVSLLSSGLASQSLSTRFSPQRPLRTSPIFGLATQKYQLSAAQRFTGEPLTR